MAQDSLTLPWILVLNIKNIKLNELNVNKLTYFMCHSLIANEFVDNDPDDCKNNQRNEHNNDSNPKTFVPI